MKAEISKVNTFLLAIILFGATLTGCSLSKRDQSQIERTEKMQLSAASNEKFSSNEGDVYPIKTTDTLTYWTSWILHKDYKLPEEQPFFRQLEQETGVKVNWIFGGNNGDQLKQNFNLMMASGDLPDIIMYDWGNSWGIPQGAESYIQNGYVIRLNEYMDEFAPNFSNYMKNYPETERMVKTDAGSFYAFPFIRGDKYLCTYMGPMIRKDLLDQVGLPIPETIDEWYTMLVAFKNEGVSVPLTFTDGDLWNSSQFIGAYGATRGFYLDGDGIKFGSVEPAFKEAMRTLNAWYQEGLIDKDIATVDGNIRNLRFLTGQAASAIGTGGTMGYLIPQLKENAPNMSLVGAKYPVLKKGDTPKFGQYDNPFTGAGCAAIMSSCKNIPLAVKYLDYAYSEKGHLLFNFGIEGESYTMVENQPVYTQAMYDYEGDLGTSISRYIMTMGTAPAIQDPLMYKQRMQYIEQIEAIDLYAATDAYKYKIPPISPTEAEAQEAARIENDIVTYVKEMYFKFLLGVESLDMFDEYVANVEKLGLSRAIELKEAALKRYNSR